MKIKTLFLLSVTIALMLMSASGCDDTGTYDNKKDTDKQLQQYNVVQKMHFYTYSWERWEVQTIYDIRITKLTPTWSVWVGDGTGEPIDSCASKGFGIPYNTSLTSPDQVYYNSSGAVVAMMEPNGLFPGGSTSATWILCVETDGSLHLRYIEPQVIVYDYPINIVFDTRRGMYRIVRAGNPSKDTNIVLPTDFNPEIKPFPIGP